MKLPDIETLRLKARDNVLIPAGYQRHRRQLRARDFTIVSNNCWGGTVYESYGLRKETPTVGMFIMPEDFVLLASDIPRAFSERLVFLEPDASKWAHKLSAKSNWGKYLIGRIGEIELHMLHYHDEDIARRKWEERVDRVNYDKLLVKFNDQNGCTSAHAESFNRIPLPNKLFLTVRDYPGIECAIRIRAPRTHTHIRASYEPIWSNHALNVTEYLNTRFAPRHR